MWGRVCGGQQSGDWGWPARTPDTTGIAGSHLGSDILKPGVANSMAPIAFDPMTHLSEERIAEIREHGMRLSDFRIGMEFWMSGTRWCCTDIGTGMDAWQRKTP